MTLRDSSDAQLELLDKFIIAYVILKVPSTFLSMHLPILCLSVLHHSMSELSACCFLTVVSGLMYNDFSEVWIETLKILRTRRMRLEADFLLEYKGRLAKFPFLSDTRLHGEPVFNLSQVGYSPMSIPLRFRLRSLRWFHSYIRILGPAWVLCSRRGLPSTTKLGRLTSKLSSLSSFTHVIPNLESIAWGSKL